MVWAVVMSEPLRTCMYVSEPSLPPEAQPGFREPILVDGDGGVA